MRILFLGTGSFALPALQALLASRFDVAGLVTQPDRSGPGHHRHAQPLKEAAESAGLPVFQPANVNATESLSRLRDFSADLFVVAAYGQILSADLLAIPAHGAINLHGSLLPKYRGAAPVQYAVWKGESESGVTIFQIEPKLDAGLMLGSVSTPIGDKETSGQLHDRLADLAAPLLLDVLNGMEQGTLTPLPQDPALVTRAPRLRKEQGQIDWSRTSTEIGWHLRAMQPWPMPFTFLHRADRAPQRLLILEADTDTEGASEPLQAARPGEILPGNGRQIRVRTGDGAMRVHRLQPSGKREMSAEEFLRGTPLDGARLGPEQS